MNTSDSILGLGIAQYHNVFNRFNIFLTESRSKPITNIIEIGTGTGVLSSIFAIYCYIQNSESEIPNKYKFSTFDINQSFGGKKGKAIRDLIRFTRSQIFEVDVFSEKGLEIISSLIPNSCGDGYEGVTLFVCDGGNKIKEFNMFAPMIKEGDFIMAHDFYWNKNDWINADEVDRWSSCEITYDDISDTINRSNIVTYLQDELWSDVVWFCGVKK